MIGNLCIIYAFTHIPLAEAYSIAFLAPIFVVALSRTFLREEVTWHRWFFLGASFLRCAAGRCGPASANCEPGHLLALFAALMGGITTTTLRKIAPVETRVSLLGWPLGYIVVINGILMLPAFHWPTWEEFALLMTIGALGGTGNIVFIAATRRSPVSLIAPAQYSQIAWAIVFGAIFFHEYPDMIAYCGLVVVALGEAS